MRLIIFAACAISVYAQGPTGGAAAFPLDERVRHYVHRTYSWQRMSLLGADTVVDQLFGEPREWGRGPSSFMYRYSSGFGRRIVRNSIELGVGIALKEDTRFTPSSETSLLRRIQAASTRSLTSPDEHGGRKFAYSRLAATVGGVLIASTWHPCERTPGHFMGSIAFGYVGHLQNSLLSEFSPDMIRVGKKVRLKLLHR